MWANKICENNVFFLSALFEALENKSGDTTIAMSMGIQSYGVSMTTLEEVFLKLGEEELDEEENKNHIEGKEGKDGAGSGNVKW